MGISWIAIADRAIQLLQIHETRKRAQFEKIIQPLFEDLRAVHTDYLAMFTRTAEMLSADGADSVRSIFFAQQHIARERVKLLATRTALRSAVGPGTATLDPVFHEFIARIAFYFPSGKQATTA